MLLHTNEFGKFENPDDSATDGELFDKVIQQMACLTVCVVHARTIASSAMSNFWWMLRCVEHWRDCETEIIALMAQSKYSETWEVGDKIYRQTCKEIKRNS